jgi:ubiquinone biosynthesis protein
MRPGVEEVIEADMAVLADLAKFVDRYLSARGYDPIKVAREFRKQLAKETDFIHEGKAVDRFRDNFRDDPNIVFPKVYWRATTRRVLTMEEIEGTLLSRADFPKMPGQERRKIAENSASAVFRMCLVHGFFHADPHPGNIFGLKGGRVCFIDCGMTGHIEKRSRHELGELVAAVINSDLDKVVRVVLNLADADLSFRERPRVSLRRLGYRDALPDEFHRRPRPGRHAQRLLRDAPRVSHPVPQRFDVSHQSFNDHLRAWAR